MTICKTISYGVEPNNDQPSITIQGERLDFRSLLARASAGILDLNAFSLPRSSDIPGNSVSDEKLEELMNRPNSVMDNCFGASVEEVESEMNRHKSVLADEIKKRKPEEPPVPAPAPAPATVPAPADE